MKFRKVIHLSDIHLRNFKRHKEYRQVFRRVYSYIKKNKTTDSVIVLTGDIVHLKTDISPELVSLLYEFLNTLNQILPVILIPGNHDANLNNKHRLDALQPVVNTIKNEHPFWYLRDSGVFTIGEVHWVHYGVFDSKEDYPTEIPNDGLPKVGLFHGAVDNIRTDTGYTLKSDVELSLFDDCDVVMLGDIHKPNNSPNGKETVKYVGSLIQQDHAESFGNHGLLVWDLEKRTSEMVPIKNDWGYVTLKVSDGEIVYEPNEIPKYPRMRLMYENTGYDDLQTIIKEIKRTYRPNELSLVKIKHNGLGTENAIVLGNVRDINYQNDLITTFAIEGLQLAKNDIERITEINKEINQELPKSRIVRNSKYIPKTFEFSNLFSYRGSSRIDFSDMRGLYGIFAKNASGKSSLFEAFTFTVWDKCKRTTKTGHVINNKSDRFHCRFTFELEGEEYVIERKGKRDKKDRDKIPVSVQFYKLVDGRKQSLNGKDRNDTNKIIREYLGTYEDFILTALSQQNGESFIDRSQKQRKEAFSQFLDLNIYDSLYRIANEKYKELSYDIKNRKTKIEEGDVTKYRKFLKTVKQEIVKLDEERGELKTSLNEIRGRLSNLRIQLKPISNFTENVDELMELKESLTVEVTNGVINVEKLEATCSSLAEEGKKFKSLLIAGKESFETTSNELNKAKKSLRNEENRIFELKLQKSRHMTNINHLKTHEFDPNCEFCVKNPFVQDAYASEEELPKIESSIISTTELINNLHRQVEELGDKIHEYEFLKTKTYVLNDEYTSIMSTAQTYKTKLITLQNKLTRIEHSIEQYNTNQSDIEFNKILQRDIDETSEELVTLEEKLESIVDQLVDYKGKESAVEKMLDNLERDIEELEKLEIRYKYLGYYLKCVSRDGIPYKVTSELIPKIEQEVNDILQGISEFQVRIGTDGKNVNIMIQYQEDSWPLELASGMERFLSGMAIRSALCNITTLPKPNFIVIDEGMAVLDKENLSELPLFFDYLKTQFDFVIIISHLEKIQDMVDQTIEINKTKEGSKILF